MRIELYDNNSGQKTGIMTYRRQEIAPLFPVADKFIADLCKESEGLLVFPTDIEKAKGKIGKLPIFSLKNTKDPDIVRIETGNIMGFIGIGDIQIKIGSRFDIGRSDFLMHYMLQRVFSFNLFDYQHEREDEDIFDFLIFMFPYYLNSAVSQGLYRQYRWEEYNDPDIKGRIDIQRHIRYNTPFIGNIAYSTREYSFDNWMTQLIRHTIEFIRTKSYGQSILNQSKETRENIKTIIDCTPSYKRFDRGLVIQKNLKSAAHPFFTEYLPLQSLCLQILRMEGVRFSESEDNIFGVLIDGSWLWEEYVNVVLQGQGFTHPDNRDGKGKIYLFSDTDENGEPKPSGPRYPDFYKDDWVLDTKYKRLDHLDKVSLLDRDDIHQVRTYMSILMDKNGGVVAPLNKPQETIPRSQFKGVSGSLSIYGIHISKEQRDYGTFCELMRENEKAFIKSLNQ